MPSPAPRCPCGNDPIGIMGVCLACLKAWLEAHPTRDKTQPANTFGRRWMVVTEAATPRLGDTKLCDCGNEIPAKYRPLLVCGTCYEKLWRDDMAPEK